MADDADLVAVEISEIGAVIVAVIVRSQTRPALVRSALLHGGGMAGIDKAALRGQQRDHGTVARARLPTVERVHDKELRPAAGKAPADDAVIREPHLEPQGSQHGIVEAPRPAEVICSDGRMRVHAGSLFGVAVPGELDSFPRRGQGVNHNRVKIQRHMTSLPRHVTPQRTGSAISSMAKTSFLRSLIAVTAFLAAGQAAYAQSAQCQRFQAELAALDRSSGSAPTGQMQAQRAEINRLVGYYRNIGCERGPLGFLAGPAPAECGSIAQQVSQLEAGYARLASQAVDQIQVDARRRQLQVAVQQTCSTD